MQRWTLWLVSLGCLALVGCGNKTQAVPCDLDVENLSGDWVSLTGSGDGGEKPDKFARARFFEEDGKKKAIYTAGRVAPTNPATNKYEYVYVEKTHLGDVLYSINMIPGKSEQRIARLRKDNRSLGLKFEGRIFVKVDEKRCALVLSDFYVTYIKGKETLDSNPAGTRTYLRANPAEPPLSYVHCDDINQLLPFATEKLDWSKEPKPIDPKGDIYKNEPAYLHYVEKAFEGSEDEVNTKLTEIGVLAEEGATYDYEIWIGDHPDGGNMKIKVEPDPEDGGRIPWVATISFKLAAVDGLFVEMHRYKTKDGKRELLSNACKVVWPEPERTADEKAADEAEKGKE